MKILRKLEKKYMDWGVFKKFLINKFAWSSGVISCGILSKILVETFMNKSSAIAHIYLWYYWWMSLKTGDLVYGFIYFISSRWFESAAIKQSHAKCAWIRFPVGPRSFKNGNFIDFPGQEEEKCRLHTKV